ncbi:hypothetical protein OG777_06820 [Micromonospora peucetia]|uniref:Uncharacterized protein n=1 Tax=Micromonospora peucetia TaxID=47871 RepID=A0A1C6UF56_9ACTN|nr:hypothetical protein [Micromonospora peucetia]MCX4386639.1 hypothetical protein [Micromonospora peucetia]WSA33972.1 hypothetical protein OIE14_07985 [Micromonospora peucetia]SCL52710.1 hypothetical protein GA0070608_1058 [Micromonospora peucetia]
MSSTSIDDLLSFEEERPAPAERSRGGRAGQVLRTLAGIAAVVVVLVAGLRLVGLRVSLPVLVTGVVALFLVRRVVAALAPPPPPRSGGRVPAGDDDGTWNWGARDALRAAINGWERPLDWSGGNRERFAERILPRLGELADERLRQRHGLTRESDPERARVLLGDRLWTFLSTPSRRPPSPRDLAAIVAELEKI